MEPKIIASLMGDIVSIRCKKSFLGFDEGDEVSVEQLVGFYLGTDRDIEAIRDNFVIKIQD